MKLHPGVTPTAVELVKRFEGLRRRAARLPDGGWTIGYGHTKTAREGAEVTAEEAELLLHYDLSEVATRVEAWTFTPLNQNQFEALTAFAFNIGLENFRRSTVLKRVNEGQHLQAAAAMELWRKTEVDGEGLVVDALVRRRAAEKAHYLTPPEGFRPSPTQVLRPVFDYSVIEAASHSQMAQRATVVDAPLEGDETSVNVEGRTAPEPPPAPVSPFTQPPQHVFEPAPLAEATAPTPVLFAPEPAHEPVAEPQPFAPVNDGDPLAAPPFPVSAPTPFGFRGFEPPPPRYVRPNEAPANEHQAEPPSVQPPAEPVYAEPNSTAPIEEPAEPASEFNLFDRPLAPPAPATPGFIPPAPPAVEVEAPATAPVETAPPGRTFTLRDDTEAAMAVSDEAAAPAAHGPTLPDFLHNRSMLFGSVGCFGVLLFFVAISTMLIGHAAPIHLLIGLIGVVLIVPAGTYFLMQHMGPPAHSED